MQPYKVKYINELTNLKLRPRLIILGDWLKLVINFFKITVSKVYMYGIFTIVSLQHVHTANACTYTYKSFYKTRIVISKILNSQIFLDNKT
jgi:hypothetical protein